MGVLRTSLSIEKYCKACTRIESNMQITAMPTTLETFSHYEFIDGEDVQSSTPRVVSDSESDNEGWEKVLATDITNKEGKEALPNLGDSKETNSASQKISTPLDLTLRKTGKKMMINNQCFLRPIKNIYTGT